VSRLLQATVPLWAVLLVLLAGGAWRLTVAYRIWRATRRAAGTDLALTEFQRRAAAYRGQRWP
jgi:hypothetical protein